MKAIHNSSWCNNKQPIVVSDYKDTNFWKQFTTLCCHLFNVVRLFQTTKIQTFESNSQLRISTRDIYSVVSDYKDTNFWKQFTTNILFCINFSPLFQTTKIQTFESNSQQSISRFTISIVVSDYKDTNFWKQFTTPLVEWYNERTLFQTTKIQTFESNSQRQIDRKFKICCCFRLQRYKLLKAIHNLKFFVLKCFFVVSDYKDTNFWKQFTTQRECQNRDLRCFRLQRYKLLKAIHNNIAGLNAAYKVVSDYKDTNFWKQFTTCEIAVWL